MANTNQYKTLALKYYGTSDLAQLTPRQLDNITNWATNTNPNTHGKPKGNKYSGNTYGKLKKIF
jgi:hypothetical protein